MAKTMKITAPKKADGPMVIKVDYANASGKPYALDFRTGPHKDKKKNGKKYACRKNIKKSDYSL